MENHIIIGLGGRGGDCLKSFRKVLFKNSLTKERANSYPIQYLYVDSSSTDLNSGWNEELGIDYSIDDWAKINTREGVEWEDIFQNLSNYPTISPWIGDKKFWAEISVNSEVGSGQLRKLGRAYFAASTFNNKTFPNRLKIAHDNVTRISKSSSQTTYHILAGLSGGTGSGTVVDIISLISNFISENSLINDRIIIYAILPERNEKGKDVLGFYYPNAYAALKEINAIGLYSETEKNILYYRPINIESFTRDSENRIEPKYTTCFVFSNENEKSRVIDYNKGLPNMIGDFLFHTIINLPTTKEGHNAYLKLTENSVIATETDKFSGRKERAIKFASASIKRIEIPEIEVIDLYGAWLLQHFVNQQKYNNWLNGKGYINEKGEDTTTDFIENRSIKDNFLQICEITLDHLSLKTPHGANDFKNSDDDWDTVSETLLLNTNNVYSKGQEKEPIIYYNRYMEMFFNSQFRGNGMGVEKYWSEKTIDIEQQTNYFFNQVEVYLLELWVSKNDRVVGLNEIDLVVSRLIKELQTISTRASNRIAHLTDPSKFDVNDADYTIAGCNREITNLIQEYGKKLKFRKSTTILSEATTFIKKLYKNKTDVIAYQFAIKLINRLTKKLESILSTVSLISNEFMTTENKLNEIISEKYKLFKNENEDGSYYSNNVKVLYKSGTIERDFGIILNEKSIFNNILKGFRRKIQEKCSALTFENLYQNLKVDTMLSEYIYYLNSKIPFIYEQLQNGGLLNPNDKLVGRNVLNYFENEFKPDVLENFLKNIKDETGVYAKLSSVKDETLDATGIKNYAIDKYVLQFPAYRINEKAEAFEKSFYNLVKRIFPDAEIIITFNNERANEFTVFKAKANMAVRSFDMVSGMMHDRYEHAYLKQKNLAELTIHTEGSSESYPKIIPYKDKDKEKAWSKWFDNELISYFLLGFEIGIVEKIKDKYVLNLEPENPTSTKIFVISNAGDKFYDIKDFLFKIDILDELPLNDRITNQLINAINALVERRENRKEIVRNTWIENIKYNILPVILKEDYDDDKTDSEYHKILLAYEFLNKSLILTK